MSMHPQFRDFIDEEIPELTIEIAKAAFPKGNQYMQMRDELGVIYDDELFADLYPKRGQPAIAPWQLALITVMQFSENLTDRQAADAVRGRIDWKYALGLELTDAGFDFSVLSEFRSRLMEGNAENRLLDRMLTLFQERDLLKKEKQRTDATDIAAAVRELNRLEVVGETLRSALNEIALVAPTWLQAHLSADWFKRYSQPIVDFRLPKVKADRDEMGIQFGQDGHYLLKLIYEGEDSPERLADLPTVEILRQVWVQNFFFEPDGRLAWRTNNNVPPSAQIITSPYDPESRYSRKRGKQWRGYKVHLTETCDEESPNLITHVHTTVATTQDVSVIDAIHDSLAQKQMTPSIHWVDGAYISADTLVASSDDPHKMELLGPAPTDRSWQARSDSAYDQTAFTIDWDNETVSCPQGKQSRHWKLKKKPKKKTTGQPIIEIRFDKQDCTACPVRALCTKSVSHPRTLKIHPQPQHTALHQRRDYQKTTEFKDRYKQRAGVEGTISNAVFTLGMRRTRYRGLTKTHFQHIATATAINLQRVLNWTNEIPRSRTRISHFGRLAAVS